MSGKFEVDPNTKLMQARASQPSHSAWVSANAGSGKTFVLSRRVVRLLLAGAEPSRILCLTYTKAAAGEMSNRVFEILGKWATLSDEELRKELHDVEGVSPTTVQLDRARILFAKALETPGGLKIQTIHAFCEALLHQFPLEANVPGNFSVMDDGQQAHMIAEARRRVIIDADRQPDSILGHAFFAMMDVASDWEIDRALENIVARREELADWLSQIGSPGEVGRQARSQFGFAANETVTGLCEQAVSQCTFTIDDLRKMVAIGRSPTASKTDASLAERVEQMFAGETFDDQFSKLVQVFLTAKGEMRKFRSFASKNIKDEFPDLEPMLDTETSRLIKTQARIKTLRQIIDTEHLMTVAEQVINQYRTDKRRRGLLDFDDLINRTGDLLTRKDARAWVLYKLDLGIDHILLDEAQDTSPEQWQIISALVDEFFTGESARLDDRTVFAVGDEKQSIYSFRGAEPRNFSRQRRKFLSLANAAKRTFENVELGLSFRSTSDVLGAVDTVFALEENARGLTFDMAPPPHTAARRHDPGSVEVWDLIQGEDEDDPENWHEPVDASTQHQALQLANRIAQQLGNWIDKAPLHSKARPINAGDILVLVRSRDRFIGALNRALKDRNIPVAGADRLVITDHIAVQDLIALGQVVLTPDDDLSLATLLKSPLIGLNEKHLLDLSLHRFGEGGEISLYRALASSTEPQVMNAYEQISGWQRLVGRLPAYEFYARILNVQNGRKNMLARLGSEAEDVIDAFLNAALDHEMKDTPGIQAFINDLMDEQPEIKREMDQTAGEVRIMTVHAAKGLEAPIVFLVDKCAPAFNAQKAPALYRWTRGDAETGFLWSHAATGHGDVTLPLKEEERRREEEEHRRLLYVGMTRAEDRLIICGYRGKKQPPNPNWHAMITTALEPDWQDITDADGNIVWHQWKTKESPPVRPTDVSLEPNVTPAAPSQLPKWVFHNLPAERALPRPLNPSRTQAVIDEVLVQDMTVGSLLADRTSDSSTSGLTVDPRVQGTALHKLLQVLPQIDGVDRRSQANSFLDRQLPKLTSEQRTALVDGVINVLEDPRLKGCFDTATSGAEVPVIGKINLSGELRPISGTIDRLAEMDEAVYLIDYKTSPHVPNDIDAIAPDYTTQMALYRALIAPLYPKKPVLCWLIWTHAAGGPVIMELPSAQLDQAMHQIAQL